MSCPRSGLSRRERGSSSTESLLFLIPLLVVTLIYSAPFIAYSFSIGEISEAPGGLPYRWAIKLILPIAFALIAVATVSRLSRVRAFLFGSSRSENHVRK